MKIKHMVLLGTVLAMVRAAESSELEFEYVGKAVQEEGMHVWGSSPVMGPDGKVHLYVARWPMDTRPNFSGWYKDCEIAHYVGDQPEGPFTFLRVAVPDQDGAFNSPHNPTIKKIDGKYALCFIVNENSKLKTQRIVMYVADDLSDHWKPAAGAEEDGTILRKSTRPADWNYTARLGVSNPTLVKCGGRYFLYNKSVIKGNPNAKSGAYAYGVAVADKLEGPYRHYPNQVTPRWKGIEDAYAFGMGGSVYLLSRDFGSKKGSHGGGLLWKSKDGYSFPWKDVTRSYEHLSHYVGAEALENAAVYRGDPTGSLERPQMLCVDGRPAYVYMATGINTTPGCGSCSHLFRVRAR